MLLGDNPASFPYLRVNQTWLPPISLRRRSYLRPTCRARVVSPSSAPFPIPRILSLRQEIVIPLSRYDYDLPDDDEHETLEFSIADPGDLDIVTASIGGSVGAVTLINRALISQNYNVVVRGLFVGEKYAKLKYRQNVLVNIPSHEIYDQPGIIVHISTKYLRAHVRAWYIA